MSPSKRPPQCSAPRYGHYRDSKTALKCPVHGPEARRIIAQGGNLDNSIALAPPKPSDFGLPERAIRRRGQRDPQVIVDAMSRPGFSGGKSALSKSDDASQELLNALSMDGMSKVRSNVARHPRTSLDTLIDMVDDPDANVRWCIARRAELPTELKVKLTSDSDKSVRREALRHPDIPSELLLAAAMDTDVSSDERASIAANPNSPQEALDYLLNKKGSKYVISGLSSNPSISRSIRDSLMAKAEEALNTDKPELGPLANIARNPGNTESDVASIVDVASLYRDIKGVDITPIHQEVLRNSGTTEPMAEEILSLYTRGGNRIPHRVALVASTSPSLSDETLDRLFRNPDRYIDQNAVSMFTKQAHQTLMLRAKRRFSSDHEEISDEAARSLLESADWLTLDPDSSEVFIAKTIHGTVER